MQRAQRAIVQSTATQVGLGRWHHSEQNLGRCVVHGSRLIGQSGEVRGFAKHADQ